MSRVTRKPPPGSSSGSGVTFSDSAHIDFTPSGSVTATVTATIKTTADVQLNSVGVGVAATGSAGTLVATGYFGADAGLGPYSVMQGDGLVSSNVAATTSIGWAVAVYTEAADRVQILGDGSFQWGDGAGTFDTSLKRASTAQVRITPTANAAASVTTGGALNITNTGSTGAGLVVYSNQGASQLGRLVVVNQDNALNPQQALRVANAGTGITVSVLSTNTAGNEALDVVSNSLTTTVLGVTGDNNTQGIVKLTHNKPLGGADNSDSAGAVLRLNWEVTAETATTTITGRSTNSLLAAGHTFVVGNAVVFNFTAGGITSGRTYYVVAISAGVSFQVSELPSGTVLTLSGSPSGTARLRARTAEQGIYVYAENNDVTTGDLITFYNGDSSVSGTERLRLTAAGQLSLPIVTGTAPFAIASTTKVSNLNVDLLDGQDWSSPTITTPTIASFVNATHTHQNNAGGGQLDHGLALTGLSDDDHTQYALLAGRSGGQTLNGGTAVTDSLLLRANSGAVTTGAVTFDASATASSATARFGSNYLMPTALGGAHTAFSVGLDNTGAAQAIALGAAGGVRALQLGGTYTLSGDPNTTSFLVFQFGPTIALDSSNATDINGIRAFQSAPIYTMAAGVAYTPVSSAAEQHVGFRSNATYTAQPTSTATVNTFQHFEGGPMTVGLGWTIATWRGSYVNAPVGGGAVTTMVAHDIEDLTTFPVPSAPTGVAAAGGSMGSGNYRYKVTFVNATGETAGGTGSAAIATSAGNNTVNLSAVPLGPSGTTSRKIYRTAVGGAAGTELLVTTIADNTTATYTDTLADGSLGAAVPTTGTFTTPLSIRSLGPIVQGQHAGPMRIGAVGAPTSGVMLDVQGKLSASTAILAGAAGAANTGLSLDVVGPTAFRQQALAPAGTVNDQSATSSFLVITPTANSTYTGFSSAGAAPVNGQRLTITNADPSFTVTLSSDHTGSTPANRILLKAATAPAGTVVLAVAVAPVGGTPGAGRAGGSITLQYDSVTSRWREV